MKFTLKKSLYLGIAALMLAGVAAPAASANVNTPRVNVSRSANHVANVSRYGQLKQIHQNNLQRIKRYQHKLNVHKYDLRKIQHRIRVHRFNTRLIKRLHDNKIKLINIINSNQRGLLRMAKTVVAEKHEINLIRHGKSFPTLHKHPRGMVFPPAHQNQNQVNTHAVHHQSNVQEEPQPVQENLNAQPAEQNDNNNDDQSYGEADDSYYTDDNGHTDSAANHLNFRNGHVSGYGEHNGQYYRYPDASGQLTAAEKNAIHDQFNRMDRVQSAFDNMDSTMENDMNRMDNDMQQSFHNIDSLF